MFLTVRLEELQPIFNMVLGFSSFPELLVTGIPARFDLIPKDIYLQIVGQYLGELVALDLWEMFYAYADIGFGAAGEPEALENTKNVQFSSVIEADFLSSACISILGLTA